MKRFASFDIGTRNLSFQIVEGTKHTFNIETWENIDLKKFNVIKNSTTCEGILSNGKNKGCRCMVESNLLPYVSYEEDLIPPNVILDKMRKEDLIKTCTRLLQEDEKTLKKLTVINLRQKLENERTTFCLDLGFSIPKLKKEEILPEQIKSKNYCGRHYPKGTLYQSFWKDIRTRQQKETGNVSRMRLAENMWRALDTFPQLLSVDHIDIEKQMRKDMIMIVAWIQMYLSMREYKGSLTVVSAIERFKVYDGPEIHVPDTKQYKRTQPKNKYVAKAQAKYILKDKLNRNQDFKKLETGKTDDLADTFLMNMRRYCMFFPDNDCKLQLGKNARYYTKGKTRGFRSAFSRFNKKNKK